MKIIVDDLKGPEIAQLLTEHLDDMRVTSPPESKHALDIASLQDKRITFWTLWDNDKLAGCIALKELDHNHAEINEDVERVRTSRCCHSPLATPHSRIQATRLSAIKS